MDPETSKKVSELLSLMEDISSDVDAKSGLVSLTERVKALELEIEELTRRFDQFEKTYQEKHRQIKSLKEDLLGLIPSARPKAGVRY
ncbi:MAG TPA: hypothetical protein PLA83_11975 [Deltaproteobacteria bacterium]|jgi:regulator of replication initiation timing|nr:hypothetical protein [Deltaproteobacteria bacterium]HQH99778.1 hypothetical protein [Deltaproteobacteria bacterium]HQJ07841.1 hypothetical protein [Deltaproteobacteria bacterium]